MIFNGFFTRLVGSGVLLIDGVVYDLTNLGLVDYGSSVLINGELVDVVVNSLGRFGHYVIFNDDLYFSKELVEIISQELIDDGFSPDLDEILSRDGLSDGFINHLLSSDLISEFSKSVILDYLIKNDVFNGYFNQLVDEPSISSFIKIGLFSNLDLNVEQLMFVMYSGLDGYAKNMIFLSHYEDDLIINFKDLFKSPSSPHNKLELVNYFADKFTPSLVRDLLRGVKSVWGCDSAVKSVPFKERALSYIVNSGYVLTSSQFDFVVNNFSKDYSNKILFKSLINGYEPSVKQLRQLFNFELTAPLGYLFNNGLTLSINDFSELLVSDHSYGFKNAVLSLALRNGFKPDELIVNKLLSYELVNPLKWLLKNDYSFNKSQLISLKRLGLYHNNFLNWFKRR